MNLVISMFILCVLFWISYHCILYRFAKSLGLISNISELFISKEVTRLIMGILTNSTDPKLVKLKDCKLLKIHIFTAPLFLIAWWIIASQPT